MPCTESDIPSGMNWYNEFFWAGKQENNNSVKNKQESTEEEEENPGESNEKQMSQENADL